MTQTMRSRSGFTLVELMIVVAVLSLLALIAVPKFADAIRKANEAATRSRLGAIRSALHIYAGDTEGNYPTDHLECLIAGGKYLSEIPKCDLPPYHVVDEAVDNSTDLAGAALFITDVGHWVYSNDPASDAFGTREAGNVWVGCTHVDTRGVSWSDQ